jgi:archaellum biogenesis ATPase FlaH
MNEKRKKIPILDIIENIPNPPKLSPFFNRQIDKVLHKPAEKDKGLVLVDSLAHMLAETADSMVLSITKSLRYNLRKLVEGGKVEEE